MADFDNVLEAGLQDIGDEMVYYLTQELLRAGKDASGRLINSLSSDARKVANGLYELIIQSEDYLKYVDQGRRPGKYVPVRALRDWVRFRGIPQSAVYAINRKIYRFGIEPTYVISRAERRFLNNLDPIQEEFLNYTSSVIVANIRQKFK